VELTRETPAPGLTVWQPRRGYRFGGEVYALAAFALRGGPARTAIDLGCGSGVVGLLLARRGVEVRGVERDVRWVAVARRNAEASAVCFTVEHADVRTWSGTPADLVVANPPWFVPTDPVSPDPWRAVSRSMLHGDVADFAAAGLRHAPRVCLVTRRERLGGLPGYVARRVDLPDDVVLVELRDGRGETRLEELDVVAATAWLREA
jgi:tRNA1(Val) A37 N6-methylase TrmN6